MEHYLERYKDQFFNIFNIKNENYLIDKKSGPCSNTRKSKDYKKEKHLEKKFKDINDVKILNNKFRQLLTLQWHAFTLYLMHKRYKEEKVNNIKFIQPKEESFSYRKNIFNLVQDENLFKN